MATKPRSHRGTLTGERPKPLRCVKRVRGFQLLATEPQGNEFSIYMPTTDQMAERAKTIARERWLSVERAVDCPDLGRGGDPVAGIFKI